MSHRVITEKARTPGEAVPTGPANTLIMRIHTWGASETNTDGRLGCDTDHVQDPPDSQHGQEACVNHSPLVVDCSISQIHFLLLLYLFIFQFYLYYYYLIS